MQAFLYAQFVLYECTVLKCVNTHKQLLCIHMTQAVSSGAHIRQAVNTLASKQTLSLLVESLHCSSLAVQTVALSFSCMLIQFGLETNFQKYIINTH